MPVQPSLAQQRLASQHLTGTPMSSPEEVVKWLGAVQAQDYAGAKWALGLRLHGFTDSDIDQAFADGSILRTHVMRPTWHFVTPDDIRWLLELTAPRVAVKLVRMDSRLELDRAVLLRSYKIIVGALRGGKALTRTELASALAHEGIVADGLRLTHLVMHAELDAVICSGPRRGKQFTYMLLEERAPQARLLKRDEALVELVQRYFTGHGPATAHDFVWWSGLTVADAKAALAALGSAVSQEVIDGKTYSFIGSMESEVKKSQDVFLLPTFDEFLVGFAAFDESRRGGQPRTGNGVFDPPLVFGAQVVGTWKRTLKRHSVVVEFAPFQPLSDAQKKAFDGAARRYGDFLGLAVERVA